MRVHSSPYVSRSFLSNYFKIQYPVVSVDNVTARFAQMFSFKMKMHVLNLLQKIRYLQKIGKNSIFFQVEIDVVAPCVSSSENSCRAHAMNSAVDEASSLLIITILMMFLNVVFFFKKQTNWACRGVGPGTSRTRSENHTTRPTGRRYLSIRKTTCLLSNSIADVSLHW